MGAVGAGGETRRSARGRNPSVGPPVVPCGPGRPGLMVPTRREGWMHRRWMRLLGALFALTLLAAACDGDGGTPDGGSPADNPADGGGADLTIVDFGFSPTELSVTEGQTIMVANIGETSHTFTTDDAAIDETVAAGGTGGNP